MGLYPISYLIMCGCLSAVEYAVAFTCLILSQTKFTFTDQPCLHLAAWIMVIYASVQASLLFARCVDHRKYSKARRRG